MSVRVRGRVGQITEPPDVAGRWAFEVLITDLGAENVLKSIGPLGDFATEKEAQDALRREVRFISETISGVMDGKPSGRYIDMKNGGIVREWMEN